MPPSPSTTSPHRGQAANRPLPTLEPIPDDDVLCLAPGEASFPRSIVFSDRSSSCNSAAASQADTDATTEPTTISEYKSSVASDKGSDPRAFSADETEDEGSYLQPSSSLSSKRDTDDSSSLASAEGEWGSPDDSSDEPMPVPRNSIAAFSPSLPIASAEAVTARSDDELARVRPPSSRRQSSFQTSAKKSTETDIRWGPPAGSSSSANKSEQEDTLSQLPSMRPWVRRSTSAATVVQMAHAEDAASVHSHPSHMDDAASVHSEQSAQSTHSEPLWGLCPACNKAPLTRTFSTGSGRGRPKSTRPARAEEVATARQRGVLDLTCCPVSPLGELLPGGEYPERHWTLPRVRNSGSLAPHGSFTSRKGSRIVSNGDQPVPLAPSVAASQSSRASSSSSRTRPKRGSRGCGSASQDRLETASHSSGSSTAGATVDTAVSLPGSGAADAPWSREQVHSLQNAAAHGDQLAAYRLGYWTEPPRRDSGQSLFSSASTSASSGSWSSGTSVCSRSPKTRRRTLESAGLSSSLHSPRAAGRPLEDEFSGLSVQSPIDGVVPPISRHASDEAVLRLRAQGMRDQHRQFQSQ